MEKSLLPTTQINDLSLDYQGTALPCPLEEGHHMVPVKTVCQIIDVDFGRQDTWLKKHKFFAQLYNLGYTTGADGKQYEMRCLPMFDLLSWLASISENNRKTGSTDKQYAFMSWLRSQMMGMYKSIAIARAENSYEHDLVNKRDEVEQELQNAKSNVKELQATLRTIDDTLEDIRVNRFTGQTALPFPEK